jgi:hypothetical protein
MPADHPGRVRGAGRPGRGQGAAPGALERAQLALGAGGIPAPGWPAPRPGCARSWTTSGWPIWSPPSPG